MTDNSIKTRDDLEIEREKGLKHIYPDRIKIMVGMATCGLAAGAQKVYDAIIEKVKELELDIIIAQTGCIGFCQKEPLVDIIEPGKPRITYAEMTDERAIKLVEALSRGKMIEEWILMKMEDEEYLLDRNRISHLEIKEKELIPELENVPLYDEIDFFKKQMKIALRNCGFIDPDNISEYFGRGGYRGLHRAIRQTPEEVIETVTRSGLRGRGGAGFPTGLKWKFCRNSVSDQKYIICNADEGDPGAYMDRSVLEGDPHSVLEGMAIGAYAMGATEGYIYVRSEYPLAIVKLKKAIEQAEEFGLLGENIFDSDFSLHIHIAQGSGSFVCGEETSLIASIEGTPPEPRIKPPFPAVSGLWKKPTNINNVETWANIPAIVTLGSEWYSSIGTKKSKGTKVFSLVGMVNNSGLVEVPMGTKLKDIIYEIGGGILNNKTLKGVQTGGPSGGCIPSTLIDIPVDYEHLAEVGSIIGSGGMIVMDETTCMIDVSKFFLDFTTDESCGRCNSCRDGLSAMHEVLTRISEGKGQKNDIEFLEELGQAVKDFSLCALGGTAPNPILTTIRYFKDEYLAHIHEKKCPARVCKALIKYIIQIDKCIGCGLCRKRCPVEAISGEKKKPHLIDQEICIKCGVCFDVCKFDSIEVI